MFRRGPVGGVAGGRFGKSPSLVELDLGPGILDLVAQGQAWVGYVQAGWQTQRQTMWDIETCRCVLTAAAAVAGGPSCTALTALK